MRAPARRVRLAGGAAALTLALAGCGSGIHVAASTLPMSGTAQPRLQADGLTLSRAVAGHNRPAATDALADLRHDLDALRAADAVDADRAGQIEAVAARLATAVAAMSTPAPPTPVTVTRTVQPPAPKAVLTTKAAAKPPAKAAPKPPAKAAPKPPHKKHGHGGDDG